MKRVSMTKSTIYGAFDALGLDGALYAHEGPFRSQSEIESPILGLGRVRSPGQGHVAKPLDPKKAMSIRQARAHIYVVTHLPRAYHVSYLGTGLGVCWEAVTSHAPSFVQEHSLHLPAISPEDPLCIVNLSSRSHYSVGLLSDGANTLDELRQLENFWPLHHHTTHVLNIHAGKTTLSITLADGSIQLADGIE
jgi:hypothetical protein